MAVTVGRARRLSPFDDQQARFAAGAQGMRLFLLSLGILFGAIIIAYVCIRLMVVGERPDLPPLPSGLWLSTLVLLASSVTMQTAVIAARRDRQRLLRVALGVTTLLGLVFLGVQTACWISWIGPMRAALDDAERLFLLTGFYVLTGAHALHIIGGLVPLTVITARAWGGRYSREHHPGVRYTAMYWHFLGGVWLVTYATLLLGM
ncbi:MAG: cytochrome c oxidase subunit 3 [Planctomycetota bacterium]